MPLNVPLPESKVPLKVEFVVLSIVGGFGVVVVVAVVWVVVSSRDVFLSFLLFGCAPGVRLLLVCRILLCAHARDGHRFSRNRDGATQYVVVVLLRVATWVRLIVYLALLIPSRQLAPSSPASEFAGGFRFRAYQSIHAALLCSVLPAFHRVTLLSLLELLHLCLT